MNDSTKSPEELRAEQWRIHSLIYERVRFWGWFGSGALDVYSIALGNKKSNRPTPYPPDKTILHISYVRPSHEERQAANASLRRLFRELKGDYRPDEEPNPNRFRLGADF